MEVIAMRGYLLVAVLGFAAGSLCAAKKGALLRQEIKDYLCDLQRNGAGALDEVQRRSRVIVDKASPAVTQAQEEAKILRQEGEELVRITSTSLREAYERSQAALQKAHARIADKAAPALAQAKEEARGLRETASRVLESANAVARNKTAAAMKGMKSKCHEFMARRTSVGDRQIETTQSDGIEVLKAPGSPLYEVKAKMSATQVF
jgi:gas vesicle protein